MNLKMQKGIPTRYRGVQYRSRLEARWAAFFERLNWEVHYEPFDLAGWIPEFVINGRDEQIAVEVKPIKGDDEPLFIETQKKIALSGWQGDALIVSYFLPRIDHASVNGQDVGLCVGCLGETPECWDWDWAWDWALFQETASVRAVIGFCHLHQSYRDRISGVNPHTTGIDRATEDELELIWRECGNAVQWECEQ